MKVALRLILVIEFFFVVYLVFAAPFEASAASIIVDQSFPLEVRPYYQLLADHVWSITQRKFDAAPPVNIPIIVHLADGLVPRTRLVDARLAEDWAHPKQILIEIVLVDVRKLPYAQFAYQLGHEIGHVMLNPRRTNGIVESIATALSYEILDALPAQVTSGGPTLRNKDLVMFGQNFVSYRQHDETTHLASFPEDIRAKVSRSQWADLVRYLHSHESELRQLDSHVRDSSHARDLDALTAIMLRSRTIPWKSLLNLAACTSPPPQLNPQFMALLLNRPCLERLPAVFCRIGIECSGPNFHR